MTVEAHTYTKSDIQVREIRKLLVAAGWTCVSAVSERTAGPDYEAWSPDERQEPKVTLVGNPDHPLYNASMASVEDFIRGGPLTEHYWRQRLAREIANGHAVGAFYGSSTASSR